MRAASAKLKPGLILLAVLCVLALSLHADSQDAPASQTTAQPQTPPATPAKKKPAGTVDPDSTLGVRGTGTSHTVRVLLKDKPVAGARVTVKKDASGLAAASCKTGASGECKVEIGAESYIFSASLKEHTGTLAVAVRDSTDTIEIKLTKVQPVSAAQKQ